MCAREQKSLACLQFQLQACDRRRIHSLRFPSYGVCALRAWLRVDRMEIAVHGNRGKSGLPA